MIVQQTKEGYWLAHGRLLDKSYVCEGNTRREAWDGLIDLMLEVRK